MSRAAKRRAGRSALDLLEAAVQLLRNAPAGALISYYVGSVPCMLGLLYFLADMSHGAFAREHVIEASLVVAVLYLWMKCWHAVFAAKLRTHLLAEPSPSWSFGRILRLAVAQIALQPAGLFLRLIAAQILIPYLWTYLFFQNIGVLGDGTRNSLRQIIRESAEQAGLWPRQAYAAFSALFGFAIFVWADIAILIAFFPILLKTIFGIETVFSLNPWALVNTTTLATTLAVTYLCFDPIRKALCVLRCFHGASLRSGEDLRVELQSLRTSARTAVSAAILIVAFMAPLTSVRAAEPTPAVESGEFNRSIERVLQKREYAWRLPRAEAGPKAERKGWLSDFANGVWKKMGETVARIFRWVKAAVEWLQKFFNRDPEPEKADDAGKVNWSATARWTLIALGCALLLMLAGLIWRWKKGSHSEVVRAEPVNAIPDLRHEDVTADQLPEDEWVKLARELADQGELRLALRAFYLASLAHLGRRELIQLARYKSNRDYDRELRRRARTNAGLVNAFDANLLTFESAWYGRHAVTPETLGSFSTQLEVIRSC